MKFFFYLFLGLSVLLSLTACGAKSTTTGSTVATQPEVPAPQQPGDGAQPPETEEPPVTCILMRKSTKQPGLCHNGKFYIDFKHKTKLDCECVK